MDFGPGVISYFRMIKVLILLFAILSFLMLPVMIIYIKGGALTISEAIEQAEREELGGGDHSDEDHHRRRLKFEEHDESEEESASIAMTKLMLLDPTIGSLGQAKTQCSHQQLSINHPYHLSCTSGMISSLSNYGLFPLY